MATLFFVRKFAAESSQLLKMDKASKVNKRNFTEPGLPLSRIRTIMKSSLNTGQITTEVLFLVAKSTELFIQHLTKQAYETVDDGNTLKYNHLAHLAHEEKNLEFLLQIVPRKIKVKEFKEILEQDGSSNSSSESDDDAK